MRALYFCLLSAFKVSAGIHRDCGEECVVFVFLGTQLYFCLFGIFRDIVTGGTDGTLFCNRINLIS